VLLRTLTLATDFLDLAADFLLRFFFAGAIMSMPSTEATLAFERRRARFLVAPFAFLAVLRLAVLRFLATPFLAVLRFAVLRLAVLRLAALRFLATPFLATRLLATRFFFFATDFLAAFLAPLRLFAPVRFFVAFFATDFFALFDFALAMINLPRLSRIKPSLQT
jgi:hypothetical protein